MAYFLSLVGTSHLVDQSYRYQLAPEADIARIERDLDASSPGDFVTVPILLQKQIHQRWNARVQPHVRGAWLIYEA